MREFGPSPVALVMWTDPGEATIVWLKKLDPPVKPADGLWQNVHARLLSTDRLVSLSPSLPRTCIWLDKSCADGTCASAAAKLASASATVATTSGSGLAPPGRSDAISTEDEQTSRPFCAQAVGVKRTAPSTRAQPIVS